MAKEYYNPPQAVHELIDMAKGKTTLGEDWRAQWDASAAEYPASFGAYRPDAPWQSHSIAMQYPLAANEPMDGLKYPYPDLRTTDHYAMQAWKRHWPGVRRTETAEHKRQEVLASQLFAVAQLGLRQGPEAYEFLRHLSKQRGQSYRLRGERYPGARSELGRALWNGNSDRHEEISSDGNTYARVTNVTYRPVKRGTTRLAHIILDVALRMHDLRKGQG